MKRGLGLVGPNPSDMGGSEAGQCRLSERKGGGASLKSRQSGTRRAIGGTVGSPRINILILTCSIGSGHMSVARALKDGLKKIGGSKVRVDVIDFAQQLSNVATTATKKVYLNSLKISPRIWELFFAHTSQSQWPIKILNTASSPFIRHKLHKLLQDTSPDILVSTYPLWDILLKKVLRKHAVERGLRAPFVSVITDTISIHRAWTGGNPDFFIAPNEETRGALLKLRVPAKRIKVFGYPVQQKFFRSGSRVAFLKRMRLSPTVKTLLLILSTGMRTKKVRRLLHAIETCTLRGFQLIVISFGDAKWGKMLSEIRWPWPTRITGWTNQMPDFLNASDIVLTKAGGSTVMECMSCEKPMLIIDALPGQEAGNALYVKKHRIGYVVQSDMGDFEKGLNYVHSHAAYMKKTMRSLHQRDAAENAAEFLLSLH